MLRTTRVSCFVKKKPSSAWEAALLLVNVNGNAKYKMAIDLRLVNAVTISVVWPIPHLDSEATDFTGSTCFSIIDFIGGY